MTIRDAVLRPTRGLTALAAATLLVFAHGHAQAQGDPALESRVWRGHQIVAGELLVQFEQDLDAGARRRRHTELGATELSRIAPGLARVRLPADADLDDAVRRYEATAGVRFAQPNALHQAFSAADPLVLDDPGVLHQWALSTVRAHEAWSLLDGAPTALVAVIDSGVDVDHPDLAPHFVGGHDFYADDDNPGDLNGHGTHCAGISAAVSNNGLGIAGASDGCGFLAYRVGNTSFPSSALVAAIHDARARGALVLSMSWGTTFNDTAVRNALQAAATDGIVLVGAAGNYGSTQLFYPAAHPFVIGVASSRPDDTLSSFSNYGPWVDLAAPGQGIYSTWKDDAYTYSSGTSMAAPLVAGFATLMYAQLHGRSPANAERVRAALQDGAVPVGDWVAHGRVDFLAAVDQLLPPEPATLLGVSPPELEALGGEPLQLLGVHLSRATGVTVGGLPAPDFVVHDDQHVSITAPRATGLGTADVAVTSPGGSQGVLQVTYVETEPPRLDVAPTVDDGGSVTWAAGGGALELCYLLVSLDGQTGSHLGFPILAQPHVLSVSWLDGNGLFELNGTLPAGLAGLTFWSQTATLTPGQFRASAIEATEILP